MRLAQQIRRHAEGRGGAALQFAVAWVLSNRFTAEDEALVAGLVAPGHPSTPSYNDPAYPIEARPTWTS